MVEHRIFMTHPFFRRTPLCTLLCMRSFPSMWRASLTAIATCGALSAASSWALGDEPAEHRLNDVTVTARALQDAPLLTPAQQLSGAALTQRQGSTLGETLDNLPGVANSSFGPNVGRPMIRGLDGDRVQILQNGGTLLDASSFSYDHAVPIDPLTTERIEVLRGPASLLYGGSALGGAVNVIDNRIARTRNFGDEGGVLGKAELRAGGAANERSQAALLEAANNRVALHVDAFDRRTDDLKVPIAMHCGNGWQQRVCNSDSHTRGGGAGLTLLADHGYLGLSASEYRSDYGTVAEDIVKIGMRRQHHVLEGEWRQWPAAFEKLFVQWGHTNYTHTEFDAGVPGTRFDNQGHALRVQATQKPASLGQGLSLEGVMGVQRDAYQLSALGTEAFVPTSRTQQSGVFTYQALKTGWGEWRAGARVESVDVQSLGGGNFVTSQNSFSPKSLSLGVLQRVSAWELTANLTRSQRAPRDYELYANGDHVATHTYEVGRANLSVEQAHQLDLGAAWRAGPHRVSFNVYQSQFANYIALLPTGGVAASGLNIYEYQGVQARFHGWEAQGRWRLIGGSQALWSPDASRGAWDIEARADAVQARDLTHGQAMPRIAPMRLGTDLLWAQDAWGARFGFVHAWAQNDVPQDVLLNQRTTPSYTLWNAGLNYHTHVGGTHWMWFARLDNLTNQVAYASTSILRQSLQDVNRIPPMAGRSVRVGVQTSF
jgi:iron complex outermembrane receptor protein